MDKKLMAELRAIEWDSYDLKADLYIDKYALDVAAARQATLMAKWSALLSQAMRERDKAKEALTNKDSLLQKRARAGEMGEEKSTETAIKAWVNTHPEHTKLSKKKRIAESHVTQLSGAVKAIDANKYMITELDKLFLAGYFAEPSIHAETERSNRKHRAGNAKTKLAKKMAKKAKKKGERDE